MKYDKIVLAGGNGYLGQVLQEYYKPLARAIIVLSRKASPPFENVTTVVWDAQTMGQWAECLSHADMLINITSATIYRHAEDRPQDETTGEIGYGFSIDVCKKWEDAFFQNPTPRTRKVALRMGIVFGKRDGAFPRLLALTRAGLGGKQGNGQQYVSWIHEQDAAKCTEWLLQKRGGIRHRQLYFAKAG